MSLKILCSGYLVRHPVGGLSWHHIQYLKGLQNLGHQLMFFEHYGWPASCYDPDRNIMTSDPTFGVAYVAQLFQECDINIPWTYLAEDGMSHGVTREELSDFCSSCDIYLNLSNVNWIPEIEHCRRRILVDTDPVFTQIGAHGIGVPFSQYHALFTYGECVHLTGCSMPTADVRWLPTRQPVVLDQWPLREPNPSAPFSTVINWASYKEYEYQGRIYGQKDREFEPFFSLPQDVGRRMSIAVSGPDDVKQRLLEGGWSLQDPMEVTRDPWTYQEYIGSSIAEFCVAKHGYVSTQCGWFSDRSSAYLAMGRPVVVQDTGFSQLLPCGEGLIPFRSRREAINGLKVLNKDYAHHCRSAREIAEQFFDAEIVISKLLERSL